LPVYSTFKAIESKDHHEQDKWILYWAVYGSFGLVEPFSDRILSWFPLYHHMKFAFLVWLQLPSTNGSRHLYTRYLRPFLLRHQTNLDQIVNFLHDEMVRLYSNHQQEIQYFQVLLGKCAVTVSRMLGSATRPVLPPQDPSLIEPPNGPAFHIQESDYDHND